MSFVPIGQGRTVRGVGPLGARLVLVGEAPGREEVEQRVPFVGQAGQFQSEVWARLGIDRDAVRIENVLEVRPPENDLWRMSDETLRRAQESLHRRLGKLTGPVVIVPTGNFALNTLRRQPIKRRKKDGKPELVWVDKISNWRGSIARYVTESGAKVKMIPTVHPAGILWRQSAVTKDVWEGDWERIAGDLKFRELRRWPRPTIVTNPSPKECWTYYHHVKGRIEGGEEVLLAVDIETPGGHIHLVGFSSSEEEAFVIQTSRETWLVVTALLQLECEKVFHHGIFDTFVLRRRAGIRVKRWRWDTMLMHHAMDPADRHSLAYCASRDLRVQFWKDEAKEESDGGYTKEWTRNPETFARYCGKDVSATRSLVPIYRDRLREAGAEANYHAHYGKVVRAALDLSLVGVRVDQQERQTREAAEIATLATLAKAITATAGFPLTGALTKKAAASGAVPKGTSPKQTAHYFYDVLGCKVVYKRGTTRRTCDELTIRRLMRKYKKARPVGMLWLDFQRHNSLRKFLAPNRVDDDDRMRGLFKPTTIPGRLACSKPTKHDRGANLQNQDRQVRPIFIADKGELLAEWDASQAESRIVDGASGDPRGLELARTPPWELDQHRLNASLIFDKAIEEIDDDERQLGKRTRHACNYGMEGARMAEVALVETEGALVLDPDDCEEWIAALKAGMPSIPSYHRWIEEMGLTTGRITTSWGLWLKVRTWRLTKKDYKDWFAYFACSEVARLTNQWGWLPARKVIKRENLKVRIVNQGHDSILASGRLADLWTLNREIMATWGREREYPGANGPWALGMPIGVKIGPRWGKGMIEWKRPPSRAEFMAAGETKLQER